jgi:putative RNA 2'-phosphotransferase
MTREMVRLSRFLSLVLRHDPGCIGLTLDKHGWAGVGDLVAGAHQHGIDISEAQLEEVVANNDKKRFAFSPDHLRIRASQGHSVDIDLGLPPRIPPTILYHGTSVRFLDRIKKEGLNSQRRRHVHLSKDKATALSVGQRHGKPVIMTIRTGDMHKAGSVFYMSDNGVWLTSTVPSQFISWDNLDYPEGK